MTGRYRTKKVDFGGLGYGIGYFVIGPDGETVAVFSTTMYGDIEAPRLARAERDRLNKGGGRPRLADGRDVDPQFSTPAFGSRASGGA